MGKRWLDNGEGEEVKNKGPWEIASDMLSALEDKEIVVHYIKGHVFQFGKVTAKKLIELDTSLQALYDAVAKKFDVEYPQKTEKIRFSVRII